MNIKEQLLSDLLIPQKTYLVFDLDGTVVFDGKRILPEIEKELKRIEKIYPTE
ncbi:hypothetical protein [Streptococcus catagoni]|uniref:hypothetical protein n=1 Tax=Streptococcus catagoni TaxID=2654874 RepID=UPI001408218A|nr:hypothetical protein [Streptococcus catagoni]